MYRIIAVDDELWSLIGFRKLLESDAERFELIYEASDPVDALEQICEKKPDAVFTDVRMPEISGIELMRKVKERGIKSEFVVISGFAEFQYAQQAMWEGAVDYQLKPFDKKTMKEVLDRLYDRLEYKRRNEELELYSRLKDPMEDAENLLRDKFNNALYSKFQIILINYNGSAMPENQLNFGDAVNELCLRISFRKAVYIINSSEDMTQEILDILKGAEDGIESAAISRSGGSASMFAQLVDEAESALRDAFIYSGRKIFQYKKARRHVTDSLERTIQDLYEEKKYPQIETMVRNLPQLFLENHLGVEDALKLYNGIVLLDKKGDGSDADTECVDIYEFTERFADIEEMSAYLSTVYSGENENYAGTVNEKFQEMVRYIERHYMENLSLSRLCKDFYINMSYCCELFKKYNSMTFSQYLTDIRIKKACELLRTCGMSVSEVCDKVGYNDYFYFNRVFKKKTGYTPSEYRKNGNGEN